MKKFEDIASQEILSFYREAAIDHGLATNSGDHKRANAAYKKLILALREIRQRGDEAIKEFMNLLEDCDLSVRLWAATHALEFKHGVAERTLKMIASGPSSLQEFSARLVLDEWKSGGMVFPE